MEVQKMVAYTKVVLTELYSLIEHIEIYKLIKERELADIDQYIPLEQVLKEN